MVFPFLSLPLEIRLPIYRHALPCSMDQSDCEDENFQYDWHNWSRMRYRSKATSVSPDSWVRGRCPNIMYLNHQVHEEACGILYGENTFSIYVKHPRHPRLPLNESRPDEESFVLFPWLHRSWYHPANPTLPLPMLRTHPHFSKIRKIHVSLPELRDLMGVETWLRVTSYASHKGISKWKDHKTRGGGLLDGAERERMLYVQKFKDPMDEVAMLLQALPRIDRLSLIIQSERIELSFIEYLASKLLDLRGVRIAKCIYRRENESLDIRQLREIMVAPLMRMLETNLESRPVEKAVRRQSDLTEEVEEMHHLLQVMRNRIIRIRQLRAGFKDDRVDYTVAQVIERDIMEE